MKAPILLLALVAFSLPAFAEELRGRWRFLFDRLTAQLARRPLEDLVMASIFYRLVTVVIWLLSLTLVAIISFAIYRGAAPLGEGLLVAAGAVAGGVMAQVVLRWIMAPAIKRDNQ